MARQRGKTWQADVLIKGQRLRPGGFRTEADAGLWEAQATAADERGEPIPKAHSRAPVAALGMTLGALRALVLATPAPDGWKGTKDIRNCEARSQMALDHFGANLPVAALDTTAADAWVAVLTAGDPDDDEAEGNSVATINRKIAVVSKLLTYALARKLIATKPHLPRFKEGKGRVRSLSWAEEATALAKLEELGYHDVRQLAMFLLDTGARISEALAAKPGDENLVGKTITFWETKSGSPRTIPLTPRAMGVLAYFRGRSTEQLIPLQYHNAQPKWWRTRGLLGVAFADVPIHVFRHTCCSRLVIAGHDLRRVQVFMGHKTIATTLRYAHLAPDSLSGMTGALTDPANVVRMETAQEQTASNVTQLVPKRVAV